MTDTENRTLIVEMTSTGTTNTPTESRDVRTVLLDANSDAKTVDTVFHYALDSLLHHATTYAETVTVQEWSVPFTEAEKEWDVWSETQRLSYANSLGILVREQANSIAAAIHPDHVYGVLLMGSARNTEAVAFFQQYHDAEAYWKANAKVGETPDLRRETILFQFGVKQIGESDLLSLLWKHADAGLPEGANVLLRHYTCPN